MALGGALALVARVGGWVVVRGVDGDYSIARRGLSGREWGSGQRHWRMARVKSPLFGRARVQVQYRACAWQRIDAAVSACAKGDYVAR